MLRRSVPLANRPLTRAASPAKFGCVVLVVAAIGFSEQSFNIGGVDNEAST